MTRPSLYRIVLLVWTVLVMSACAGGSSASAPPPAASGAAVTTPGHAVDRVVATEPRLAGIRPFDTGLIGQSNWYTVEPASGVGAFLVTVRVGWGDCESGCIDEHGWVYAVTPDGGVRLVNETGPPVPGDAWPSPDGTGETGIRGVALARPVCPVETVPPDPECAPRPVTGAVIIVRDGSGAEMARATTGPDGGFFVPLEPGPYTLEPQPVEGFMGTPAHVDVSVQDGESADVQLDYDTGIR
jgi:hypothetical protein